LQRPAATAGIVAQYHRRMAFNGSAVSAELRMAFGEIDIYLFDQPLRGRFDRRQRV
jgi:hypothetical protein